MKNKQQLMFRLQLALALVMGALVGQGEAYSQAIQSLEVKGNAKVEETAIVQILETKKGGAFDEALIRSDIIKLFDLGYFSDISFYREDIGGGQVKVRLVVVEKPAIASIQFTGLDEVEEKDIRDKISSRLYTIVNEAEITSDLGVIEKLYAEKGFFLAKATYSLENRQGSSNEVDLVFQIDEQGKVFVSKVEILGNEYFNDSQLLDLFMTRPMTRAGSYGSTGTYGEELVNRDAQFLSFYYQDYGFAKVKVAEPTVLMTSDRNYVDVTYNVEEGLQYNVGTIDVSGDILYEKQELFEWMQLKPGELFRFSRFQKDIEMLVDKYGDLGYAYVDPNPKTRFNDETKTVDLNYEITKGEKVYFGTFEVVGNTKTRDNVVRREVEVADSELYSGTRLRSSKQNVQRLGFFEEVQFLKERDAKNPSILNYRIKVKEKPTGQLQAALGYSPGGATKQTVFGQGRYDEKNQSGRGWATNVSLKSDGGSTFNATTGFSNPRVNDSQWSLGINLGYEKLETSYVQGVTVDETRKSLSFTGGRKIFELIRGSITYSLTQISQDKEIFILQKFRSSGLKKSLIFGLSRKDLNDFLDPTEGTSLGLRHQLTGGALGGDFRYMETSLNASWYYPLDFTDTYRTHFKIFGSMGKLWSYQGEDVPLVTRYRLGGPNNLRGFKYGTVSPKYAINRTPELTSVYYVGGDKQLYMQFEYFMPLIPEAGIKALLFADVGRVFNNDESISFGQGYRKNIGYGFRWITPIAPFRFEFAYPIEEDGSLGKMVPIFNIGY